MSKLCDKSCRVIQQFLPFLDVLKQPWLMLECSKWYQWWGTRNHYFIVLLTTELCVIVYCPADAGPGLGQYDLFCPDVLGQGVRYAPAVIDEGGSEQRFYDLFYSVGLRLWLLHFNLTCSVG